MEVPVVDRAIFESLFGVRRRRAIQLMSFFGGFQAGRTFLVDRMALIRQLEPVEAGAEFVMEQRRRQRLIDSLEQVRRHRAAASVSIAVALPPRDIARLPEGICLQPGFLNITFDGAEDLLRKLYSIAQAAANDFEAFRAEVQKDSRPAA
jgi:hypothetical protein